MGRRALAFVACIAGACGSSDDPEARERQIVEPPPGPSANGSSSAPLAVAHTPVATGLAAGNGTRVVAWSPLEFSFPTGLRSPVTNGPFHENDPSPANPWLDYRLDLLLASPSGTRYLVPGFFAGDGSRGPRGNVWRARFTPPFEPGLWNGYATLRGGPEINVRPRAYAGGSLVYAAPVRFIVEPPPRTGPGFAARGPIRAAADGRLRDANRRLFLKAGAGSPENFFGYEGFHGAVDGVDGGPPGASGGAPNFLHRFQPHVADWRSGDPDWGGGAGRGIIGALNALADLGGNSLYVMPMNLGGDGRDTFPFTSNSGGGQVPNDPADLLQYSVRRMAQWNDVVRHANRRGILVQFVLAEREPTNIDWLGGAMSVARRLYLKQLVAHFGHYNAIEWTLCEENAAQVASTFAQFTGAELESLAEWIRAWDVVRHPLSVHIDPNDLRLFDELLAANQAEWIDCVSLQVHGDQSSTGHLYGDLVQEVTEMFATRAGRNVVVNVDEPGHWTSGAASELHPAAWASIPAAGPEDRRRRVLYDVLFSGAGIAWYFGSWSLAEGGGDLTTEDFRTRAHLLRQTRLARFLIQRTFQGVADFVPADALWQSDSAPAPIHPVWGNAEVIAAPAGPALVYLPRASTRGTLAPLDRTVASGTRPDAFEATWIDPRTGASGAPVRLDPTLPFRPDLPPGNASLDWVLRVGPRP